MEDIINGGFTNTSKYATNKKYAYFRNKDMAIDKGLYSAPKGIDEESEMEPTSELEIEIVNPESVTLDDGSMEITIIPDADIDGDSEFDMNLAEVLDESHLKEISDELVGNITTDIDGRKD